MKLGDSSVEGLLVSAGRKRKSSTTNSINVMSSNSDRSDDSKVSSAAAAQSPVEITVITRRSPDDTAGSSDNLELEGLISAETITSAEGRVTTTKSEASKANGGTLDTRQRYQ
jgi:FtsZ-interacting cell division protein ZipA